MRLVRERTIRMGGSKRRTVPPCRASRAGSRITPSFRTPLARMLPRIIGDVIRLPCRSAPVWSKYWSEASISSIENLIALITVPVPHRRPGWSRRRRSTATGSRVRRLSSSSTMRQSWHKWRAQLQPHSHRPRFARQLTQLLDGNNARDHPTSRDIAQAPHDAFA
jgi:hypothetical protein